MQKLTFKQKQHLSPQQIRFIKLLEVSSSEMNARVLQELEENPVLEQDESPTPHHEESEEAASTNEEKDETYSSSNELNEYLPGNPSLPYDNALDRTAILPAQQSINEILLTQLAFLGLDERSNRIGQHLIGSIEGDGYIRRPVEAIVEDLAFTQYLETTAEEVAKILATIQQFDPPGIAAQNLQECLLLQLKQKDTDDPDVQLAIQIISTQFKEFSQRHFHKISKKLGIKKEENLKSALELIRKLDPKPGENSGMGSQDQTLYPDFIVTKRNNTLHVTLTKENIPHLNIKKAYANLITTRQESSIQDKEATKFIRSKLKNAQWFIDALQQRQKTLLKTMNAIVQLQHDFFMDEDEANLKPLMLKHVAKEIGMDVSTVSRVASKKSVQTDTGIYPLKFFFPEAIHTKEGNEVSSSAVQKALVEIIAQEDKLHPYTDEKLTTILQEQGYHLARRTTAKYRELLHIPVARLRKEV